MLVVSCFEHVAGRVLLQVPAAAAPVEVEQEDDELQERLNAMRTT